MNENKPPKIVLEYADLPVDPASRHEVFVDFFGRFFFWIRNLSLGAARKLIESEEARQRLGSIRRKYYDRVAAMTPEQRAAAVSFADEAVNGFAERLIWFLDGRGTDLRFGSRHAYRFQIEIEVVDVETNEVVEKETVSIGGERFFGKYWGRWLNKYPLAEPISASENEGGRGSPG